MLDFLKWYLAISALGWLTFPITYRFFPNLKDKGFTFTRILGLLLWGFGFWISGSYHILQNDLAGQIVALGALIGLSIYFGMGNWSEIRNWCKENFAIVLSVEIVFLILFAAWSLVRAANPAIAGTEKPMELAFINAILRSPTFPPHDPWLSGYAISYYYFGYVIIAMLARITGIASSVAFNLTASSWFALTGVAAYGLIYNLISTLPKVKNGRSNSDYFWALFGPFYLLIVSNAEGIFEYLHARGFFWTKLSDGSLQSNFWRWLDLKELTNPPAEPFSWVPNRIGGILWWRASRVLSDYDLNRNWKEIIDEFPFFSFILADLHPHLLTMPFVLLVLALGYNFYLSDWVSDIRGFAWGKWLRRREFWVLALATGSLAFFNTWDFPIYVALICAVYLLLRFRKNGWSKQIWSDLFGFGLLLGLTGIVIFLPFYIGFKSQAGGIIPSLEYFTRGIHFWIMFGPQLVPILALLIWLFLPRKNRGAWKRGILLAVCGIAGLWILSYLIGAFLGIIPALGNLVGGSFGERLSYLGYQFSNLHGSASLRNILSKSMVLRFQAPGTWITLSGIIFILSCLFIAVKTGREKGENEETNILQAPAVHFSMILILTGTALTLIPEFFYLIDQFGWRMNTIFKFYFEAWIVWSVAASFGTIVLWKSIRSRVGKAVFGVIWAISLFIGLAYPSFALGATTNNFQQERLTLDGTEFFSYGNPGEAAAIGWLKQAPYGTIVEAVGGSYSEFARVSEQSGLPTVLGWPGHQSQWRGGSLELGSREGDIQLLYRTTSWPEAVSILQKYGIRYIFIGSLERSSMRVSEEKFADNLSLVFANDAVSIYEVPPTILELILP